MGFLDDAINKTKEVIDVTCKKTDEIVTIQKQKFNIASLKSKREKDYAELGKIYFDLVKDSVDEDEKIRNLVEEIQRKNKQIDLLNEELNNIKNK